MTNIVTDLLLTSILPAQFVKIEHSEPTIRLRNVRFVAPQKNYTKNTESPPILNLCNMRVFKENEAGSVTIKCN